MAETLAALLLAHALAGIVLPSGGGVEVGFWRGARDASLHLIVFAGSAALALGATTAGALAVLGVIAGIRLVVDLARSIAPQGLTVFPLVLSGQGGGIGFLIAAKSVLRFGAVRDEARLSEYVIVGTLASFGWALLVSTATLALVSALPTDGIPLPGL